MIKTIDLILGALGFVKKASCKKDTVLPESLIFFCETAAADIPHRKMDGTSRATDACRPPLILAFKSSNQLQGRRNQLGLKGESPLPPPRFQQ